MLNGDLSVVKTMFSNMLLGEGNLLHKFTYQFLDIFSLPFMPDVIKTLPTHEQTFVKGLYHLLSEDQATVVLIISQWIDQVFEAIEGEVWQRRVTTPAIPTAFETR